MSTRTTTRFALLTGTVLFSLAVTGNAWADAPGSDLAQECAACHGKDGISTEPSVPTIAGYSATYASDSMIAYQEKERPCIETEYLDGAEKGKKTDMCKIAAELSKGEITAIAEHYAALPFKRAKQDFDPELAKKGKEIQNDKCKKCHGAGGSLPSDDAGILAGQWAPYLRDTFRQFSSGERPMTKKMKKKFKTLSDDDIEAVIHYFASFQ